jgi:hypothetical protein
MEIKDYRNFVNESPIKDKLNSLEVVINYPYLDSTIELKGIQSIYKFVHEQVKGWNNLSSIPSQLMQSKNHFESVRSELLEIKDNFDGSNEYVFNRHWDQIVQLLNRNQSTAIFLYDCPETDFIIDINNKNNGFTQGTIDYLSGSKINLNTGKDYLTGVIYAYEFKNQSDSEILNRRNNEKKSLGQIRTKYNDFIVEAEQHLNQYISDAKENLTNHFNAVDEQKKEKDKVFEDWFIPTQDEFTNFFDKAQKSVEDNENLYTEKLRLKAPAQYWKERAVKLKKESDSYMKWLIGVSVTASLFLFILLISLGNGFFETAFSDAVKGIKWSIILITLVSLLAFSIKVLAKMAFSSLHLSRDAEEREQLTHFYLALKHDSTVSDSDRQLILQSLFSRSDTGLLKEDSAPTMPSIIEKYIPKQ